MTTSAPLNEPVPCLAGLALIQTQLGILAKRFLTSEKIEKYYGGDAAYAINSYWNYLKTPNSILPIIDGGRTVSGHAPQTHLSKAPLKKQHLVKMSKRQLGEPQSSGRMYSTMQKRERKRESLQLEKA
ncbi:hypothetical protein K435DRAFT_843202 [Dendrothele bispora CBS 962.96]|uniref:Uncharacterized protein n=1 Tax=Dendrothele bispora (strain CBS 962.96) TaxID=1314807 RepID=A0A4V4HD25_DENBC|nr:hypothetical protein K435DRAFT_843202 [Dendrothele bispora CBS 962.96]